MAAHDLFFVPQRACAIHQRANAWRALPIDYLRSYGLVRQKTTSETVNMKMNIAMAIHDFFLGFFFCLNNNSIGFMI